MSRPLHPAYRFETEAQWDSCRFAGADRDGRGARKGLRPFGPYAATPGRFATPGAQAPAITHAGEILWRDDEGELRRLPYGDDEAHPIDAPPAIASASRLVATPGALWAAAAGRQSPGVRSR